MKIRTQFFITMLLFGVVLITISISAIVTNVQVNKNSIQREITSAILQKASELNNLANDYLIYQENLQIEQWQTGFASLSNDVSALKASTAEELALVRDIQAGTRQLKDIFDSIVTDITNISPAASGNPDPAILKTSWNRIALQSHELSYSASVLSQLLIDRSESLQKINLIVIIALIVIFVTSFLVNYLATQKRVLKEITNMRTGAAIIGAGNLDFRIDEKKNDEIGALSRAFNRMTASLQIVTANKAELENEIKERKQAEDKLHETQDYLENLFNYANAPIIVWDPNYTITLFNHAFERLTGLRQEDVLSKKLDILFPAGTRQQSLELIKRAVAGERWEVVEIPILCVDSTIRTVLWNSANIYTPDGKRVTSTIAQGQDITDRKWAEEQLKVMNEELEERVRKRTEEVINERQRLYSVLETLPVYVVLLDKDYYVPFANKFFRERFGESHGARCYEYLFKKTVPCETCESYKVMQTKAVHYWEWTGPDGRNYDIYDYPFYDTDGTLMILEMGIDITPQKRAQEALHKAHDELEIKVKERTAELEASNNELESFSYSVSHDLRAPLRSIEGFSSALLEDYADRLDDQGKQYLKYIKESSELMAALIDDLLKLSRVIRSEINYDKIDLGELAGKVIADLKKAGPDRKVEAIIPPNITAYGDGNLLRLVLENLLGNAWKFSSKVDAARIEMGTIEYKGKQTYFVRDNGVGFDMTYADRLFKPFQRLHKSSEFSGTGIGLATVHRIIRRHGGEVWAESRPGEGAIFYFTLS